MTGYPILTILILTPLLGAVIIAALPAARARQTALGFSLVALLMAVSLAAGFDPSSSGFQFVERREWIPLLGVNYYLGIDGLGLLMVVLTGIVVPLSIASAWKAQGDGRLFWSLMLLLEAGLFGTFTALNFFHWFLFWELSLIPAFFLIKLWGGPKRSKAAIQFFLYTMAGSVAMLLGFLAIFLATGTFDFPKLAELGRAGDLSRGVSASLLMGETAVWLVFAGVFLGFAVKAPLVPFHTWLPGAYSEAPTSVTILLTGLMSKMGLYGFLRVLLPMFPAQLHQLQTPLVWLAVATIVLPAAAALAQKDLKRILAYSSINHLGYCLLGIFSVARATGGDGAGMGEIASTLNGVMLQMFNHGLTASMLFFYVAILEKRGGGLRSLDDFGGLRRATPILCGLMGIALFSSIGLPGLNSFAGEFLIFRGVFGLAPWAAAVSVAGLLLTAVFLATLMQRVFHGPLNPAHARMPDLTLTERLVAAPGTALMFLLGIYPQLLIGFINSTATGMLRAMNY